MSDDYTSSFLSSTDCPVRVLKFGGTSVGTAEGLHTVGQILQRATGACRPVVVVSAAGGVTDELVQAANEAPHPPTTAADWSERIGMRYRRLAAAAIRNEALRARYESILQARVAVLRRALMAPVPKNSAARDSVLAVGERLMVPLLVGLLVDAGRCAQAVDAVSLIRTDATHGAAAVNGPATQRRIRRWCAEHDGSIPVVPGFLGGTSDGGTTTLGRGESDYSAALLARGLEAERLERWTDVDGLYTSDPSENDGAQRLPEIEMDNAQAWARDGRLGLHPRMLDPLAAAGIPLHVRCTHRPEGVGTQVVPGSATEGVC